MRRRRRSSSGPATAPCGCCGEIGPGARCWSSGHVPGDDIAGARRGGGDRGGGRDRTHGSGDRPASRSAGSATTSRAGSTTPRVTSSSRSHASSTPRSKSAARRSCTATSTTTTSSSSARGPVAIDPKPMLGEPEYDVPSFLWNPIPLPDATRRHRAPARCLRRGRARRAADADVGGDPRRLSRRGGGRDRGATRARLGTASAPPRGAPSSCSRAGWSGSYGT